MSSVWTVEFADHAAHELRKLNRTIQARILGYLRSRIATDQDPRRFGRPLTADKVGLWRYRVGDYRLVCHLEDDRSVVLILRVAHRREVYDWPR